MTVAELIERLQDCDPEAEVRTMTQESWPFENAIRGVAVREDFANAECDCTRHADEPHQEGCAAEGEDTRDEGATNDVFIVEGRQLRYGNKAAWEVARR